MPKRLPSGSAWARERERARLEPVELDVAGHHVERRSGVPAARALIVSEVSDGDRGVAIRRSAADAVLRICGVLQRRACDGGAVAQAEPDCVVPQVGERGDERVVGIHHDDRVLLEPADGLPPAFRDVLQLSVPIELVAKQVPEYHHAGSCAGDHLGQSKLVNLQ